MHIGLLAPPWIPVPPPAYGGIEQVVDLKARCLVDAGHEVTLVAAPGSQVAGVELVSPLHRLPDHIGLAADEHLHVLPALAALAETDVVIDHSGLLGALVTSKGRVPAAHVVHSPLGGVANQVYAALARHSPRLRLIAISAAQRSLAPGLPFAGVCHNGIDATSVPFRAQAGDYLAFLGRMSPDKGAAEAIAIARRAGLPIRIAAKCREPAELEYFADYVEPELGPDVEWLGELPPEQKFELLAGARALVFPISWSEPFGMVMIEAMACGTPVLATPRGSVPEVVADGRTGFVREDVDGLARAVARLDEIDREACRRHVIDRFSGEAMADAYEQIIENMLAEQGARRRLAPAWATSRVGLALAAPSSV